MSLRRVTRTVRWWARSARRSIRSGWSDIWTLRRWIMSVRLAMAVVGLVGAVTVFVWGAGGDEPYTPSYSEGQQETLCEQAAVTSAEEARRFEDETGQPGKGVTKEQCLAAYGQRSR